MIKITGLSFQWYWQPRFASGQRAFKTLIVNINFSVGFPTDKLDLWPETVPDTVKWIANERYVPSSSFTTKHTLARITSGLRELSVIKITGLSFQWHWQPRFASGQRAFNTLIVNINFSVGSLIYKLDLWPETVPDTVKRIANERYVPRPLSPQSRPLQY